MKKSFSIGAIISIVAGLVAFAINWMSPEIQETTLLIGFILIILSGMLSGIAFGKKEKGAMKILSTSAFFSVLFYFVIFEPFTIVYILTWLK